jgi:hypothetical protein
MKKSFLIVLLSIAFISCSKDDDSSERQLTPNHENMVGEWVYTTIIRANGTEESYPQNCSTKKDFAKILLNTTIVTTNHDFNCTEMYWNCNDYYFQGNRIISCFTEFDDARVTSLTATTMKLEYDDVRNFGSITGMVKGLILKKR